jgi:Spy/CpxP family protein refolding chaperone
MKRVNLRNILSTAAVLGTTIATTAALAQPSQGGNGPGYGMGPGMMGDCGMGYGMGPGMMGGYHGYSPECQKFYDDTLALRKQLHDKRFEYFEVLRNPKTTGETAEQLRNEMKELQNKIYSKAPLGCMW